MSRFSCWVFFLAFCCCTSCSSSLKLTGNEKIAAEPARADIQLLKKILEKKHPSLYWYSTPKTIDSVFNAAISSINDSLSEHQFRNVIAGVLSHIRCGHTAVRYSKPYTRYLQQTRYPQFPLSIKTWKDSMVVLSVPGRRADSVIKRGTVITSINGKSTKDILDSMFALISADGYANNFKSQVISFNFPLYYRSTFGLQEKYTVGYIDSAGKHATSIMRNYKPPEDTGKKSSVNVTPPDKRSRKERKEALLLSKRSLRIDTALNTAYMNIATFSSGRLRRFFRKSFKSLDRNNITNLIIELRLNGGGSIGLSANLAQYIKTRPFNISDTTAAIDRSLKYNAYAKPSALYWLAMLITSHKKKDGRYHFRFMEEYHYKPIRKYHFKGDVYVIQGGFTFSAASMFVGQVKNERNVTIVGEESGGGAYGNNAVHLPEFYLPNSQLRVVIPAYRIVFNSKAIKTGTGIIPEIEVPPLSVAIREERDFKLEVIRELIKAKQEKTAAELKSQRR